MNRNLNITVAEYQHKVRQQAKARQQKFREEQEARGYKNISVFLSGPFISELDRLSTEHGLNRQSAMDYIFLVYQDNVNNPVTSNAIVTGEGVGNYNHSVTSNATGKEPETVEKPVSVEDQPVIEKQGAEKQDLKPVETQTEIPAPKTADSADIPEWKTPEYSEWLFNEISRLYDTGMGGTAIERKFNEDGIRSVKKETWGRGGVRSFYMGYKKKQEGKA